MSEINNTVKFWHKLNNLCGNNYKWILEPKKKDFENISQDFASIFENLSKTKTGKGYGYPDIFLYDKNNQIMIIAEVKEQIINHGDPDLYCEKNKGKTAVDGIKHYLYKILEKDNLKKLKLNIIGLALSGEIDKTSNYKISTFSITDNNCISDNWSSELLAVNEYVNYFSNVNKEDNLIRLKKTAKEVNELMRDIPVSERPIFLAGVIISLYENQNISVFPGDIKKRLKYNPLDLDYGFIKRTLKEDIKSILTKAGISPVEKIDSVNVHIDKILKILKNKCLKISNIIVEIFIKINNIMDILVDHLEFDIMGDFYQEFLRYSSGDGGDLGIILTPMHVTELMVNIVDIFKDGGINENDIVLDPCCGTGTFLTTFMNTQIQKFAKDDQFKKNNIKKNNLIGVELNPTMYVLSIANMLVRGDGKSSIYEDDIFTIKSNYLKNKEGKKPTIGLMNPPYSQSSKKKSGNNKSEMQFIEKLINSIENNGYVAVISSKSTFFKTDKEYAVSKEFIYKNNTLKAVINMPKDLFEPHASTHTSIAIFQVGRPHHKEDYVYFYDINHDGFQVLKNNRIDIYNKWKNIKHNILQDIKNKKIIKGKSVFVKNISYKDEWIPEAWIPTDFSKIIENGDQFFDRTIKEYSLFKYKEKTGILNQELKYKNEKNPSKKEDLKNSLLSELDLFEQIQSTGLNALEIIESSDFDD